MDRILLLKIICVILQFVGLIIFGFIKIISPEWTTIAWTVFAISGFASIVLVFIDSRNTSVREGFIGAAFIIVALQALLLHH